MSILAALSSLNRKFDGLWIFVHVYKLVFERQSIAMFDAEALIQFGGLLLVLLAVYGQTGLFFCFFLPSGVLLFMAGVLIANGLFGHSLFVLCSLGVVASLLGNITGYVIGYKTGPLLYRRPDSRFFKKQHLTASRRHCCFGHCAGGH